MNCNNYFDMTDQGDSFASWQGLRGPAGPQGTPGAPGSSVELKGPVATTGDLPASAPASELWQVGTQAPYNGYFFNGTSWVNLGPVAAGATFTPTVNSDGVISWTNDGGLPNPESVNIKGPQGATGATGVTFTPSVSISGDISWTNDGWRPNPQSVNIRGPQGPQGRGVAVGGSAGQVLKKKSATNYDTAWAPDPNANVGIVQNGDTATQNISKRQYVIWKGALYIASAAIASGATLSDSNLTAVTGGGLNQFLARSQQGRIVASGSETIQLDSDSNGIVVFTGAGDSHKDIAVFRCTDQGNVSIKSMLNSSVVFTTATNSLTITNTATTAILPYFIMSW